MYDLLNKFERIVILKTIVFDIDMNFLDENDLNKISNYANDLEIDLNHKDYYNLNYPDDDDLLCIYEEWKDDICYMFEDVKNDLLREMFR